MSSHIFDAIGTKWQIDIFDNISKEKELRIKNKVLSRIEEFDKNYSRFRPDSWVVEIASKKGIYNYPSDFTPLFEIYSKLNKISKGLFTPLIGRTMEDAGYDADYSLKESGNLKSPPEFEKALKLNAQKIEIKEDILFDFGAAGKGYLIDIIGKMMRENGLKAYCIDAGGDILYQGVEKLRIGLEHPDDPTLAIGISQIQNESICGSAGNRRAWGRFHHTINPLTLISPDNIKAVWVVAKDTIISDALTTCLYLDPVPERYKDLDFEYVLLYKDNTAQKSSYFPGELFTF